MSITIYSRALLLFLFATGVLLHAPVTSFRPSFSVMLAPAGDARMTGRIIDKNFERWIAWEYVRAVKERLEREAPGVVVTLSRGPGEIVEPLQCANFANRLHVDLFVSVNFYSETAARPECAFYQFSYGDEFVTLSNELAFHPYDRAHLVNKSQAARFAQQMRSCFDGYAQQFGVSGVHKLPFAPLIGIVPPAIGLEMGIKSVEGWRAYVDPLVASIKLLMRE